MAVINITIVESEEQLVEGFPRFVSISTNIPANIFYTFDGTDPDTFSSIYTGPLVIPTNNASLTFKIFATNGLDNSAIITKEYFTQILGNNNRLPHATVLTSSGISQHMPPPPFGSQTSDPNVIYGWNGNMENTVNNSYPPQIPDGYDGTGTGTPGFYTNKPLDEYLIKFTEVNSRGEYGKGIGTLPARTTVIGRRSPNEYSTQESNKNSLLFNPKAMVVFQDSSKETINDPVMINRPQYSLQNKEIVDGGILNYNSGLDAPTTTGSFIKSYFNPRNNTMTYYYFDSSVNKWIISTSPFDSSTVKAGNLFQQTFARNIGGDKVFQWLPFPRRVLY